MGLGLKSEGEGDLPWGIRIASGFLDFLAILAVIPMCLSAAAAISVLGLAGVPEKGVLFSLATCGGLLGLFLALLVTVLGGGWLAKYMRASHGAQRGFQPVSFSRSPRFIIVEPVLLSLIIYSILAVLTWCVVKLVEGSGSLVWLMVWAVVGAASIVARKRLNGEGIDPGSA